MGEKVNNRRGKIMSETVHYKGKIKLLEKLPNETLEEQCKRISLEYGIEDAFECYDSWEEAFYQELYDDYIIARGNVYKLLECNELDSEDVFNAYENPDGTIGYDVVYYNGGCGLSEAIEEALVNMKTI